ncbi:MAG: DNA repair protein RecN [Prevotellaceae bacterium]|jgi:DNA repair protein RecN (Recombination protein N)|nr:DNA repair protein RecN [Prevotellaceae bacterium]
MLKSLYVSNYALISELNITFDAGFSVITGETGAGKSIIIGALSLILGQRAEIKLIKEGTGKCVIEAEFDIRNHSLRDFFEKNALDFDEKNCIIRRELTAAGKSRAFVNDSPVSLNQLRDLSLQLIDIHSQHENLLLSDELYQLNIVDIYAKNAAVLNDYRQSYFDLRKLDEELKTLKKTVEKQSKDADYIRFQYEQLENARLSEDEQEELEQEQRLLNHAEEIKTELHKAVHLLTDEQMNLSLLRESYNAVNKVQNYASEAESWYERLHSSYIELKDVADEMATYEERIAFDPERLLQVSERLNTIYNLQQKYKVASVADLLALKEQFSADLLRIESFDEEIEALEKKLSEKQLEIENKAASLSDSRKSAFGAIEDYLINQLVKLGIPNVRFKIGVDDLPNYTENGRDEIKFLFSANKNRSVQPIAQIASGGEISRLMLSIKAMIAHKSGLPTIIFDEIDTGVSGEIAHRMGDIMQQIGKDIQVLTITHLPQIAAKGRHHYRVYKDEHSTETETRIIRLTESERQHEIAAMLSGKTITAAVLNTAKEMLKNSD